ncbi:protein serine/threonine phosphatase 2C [Saitoella complicata NRRL Y-17804]|uniref:Protein phosphatase n=1 Tax=Saitoella complicata (strain BCRC 22490 / CBS 7301 / JCM 7358 / NBRC 10748 / NRRL Y-17804) TaxID=698492 RepID=A0A0E9N977_SAICN|nr:protein serine/threonine phosphatase 2C [Saitoella complicata NRRL Y-17804]ODQ52247.1 protein serine/threonine phosphatase 2C [Saitoella complicata NRRL Y-17804]GAO45955.1 hypothetical protein G7K_0200-t1 [Saitoella complicata NRRL Y-17804]
MLLPRSLRLTVKGSRSFATTRHASRQPSYTCYLSAAYSPKKHRKTPTQDPEVPDTGEDAFFLTSMADADAVALGVADGVGGWSDIGVDPSLFSRALCEDLETEASAIKNVASRAGSPKSILERAFTKLVESKRVEAGSSTACVATIGLKTGTLRVANLGDSGYLLFRPSPSTPKSPLFHASSPQTHFFNAPLQLSIIPPSIRSSGHLTDHPSAAAETTHQLQHGDVVCIVTDGVTDNLSPESIASIVREEMRVCGAWTSDPSPSECTPTLPVPPGTEDHLGPGVDALARAIVIAAKKAGWNTANEVPFGREARKYGYEYEGGKPDDITVVVGLVREVREEREGGKGEGEEMGGGGGWENKARL